MHLPGIEPEASDWKPLMLPLHQRCENVSKDGIEPPTY